MATRRVLWGTGISMRYLTLILITLFCISCARAQPDTTSFRSLFGERVLVFDEEMDCDSMQEVLDWVHKQQAGKEFTDQRYALLFKPGNYNLKVTVDYYVQALGLGRTPDHVVIKGAVQSNWSRSDNHVTTQFWRGAENFKVYSDTLEKWMLWAVSQAAPMRRMHIVGDINFDKGGWASGGVLANSIITGRAGLTSGQQWFTRNSEIGYWEGGNWNRVFVGVRGAPEAKWPEKPITVINSAPVIRDKPFLYVDDGGEFAVFVPDVTYESSGVSWKNGDEKGTSIPINDFYIAEPEDDAAAINAALESGNHLLFTPGIYELDEAIRIEKPNTVVLGLGLPTLIPSTGSSAIETADADGIILAGFMVDAGLEASNVLVQIGEPDSDADHSENPISLHDLYCRIGGFIEGTATTCLEINSNHVIGDHFWLWRADHGRGANWDINRSDHGLIVNGDNVTIYGLFNEHFQHYQTLWNGESGRTYFYQSEIPYEPPSNEIWNDEGKPGYASYKVADEVEEHQAWGLGIYSFFRGEETTKNNVRLENAMEVPDKPGIRVVHISTFAGRVGGINHVINGTGPTTNPDELNLFDGWNLK